MTTFAILFALVVTPWSLVGAMRKKSQRSHMPFFWKHPRPEVLNGTEVVHLSPKERLTSDQSLSVMSWNVLARPYTKYNQKFHRNEAEIESVSQTQGRYKLAGETIVELSRDIVLLQECDEEFFKREWNEAAEKVKDMYDVFPCRSCDKKGGDENHACHPGTAVLVKREGSAVALQRDATCIGGGSRTGGPSKIATILRVRAGSKDINVVSTHFAGGTSAKQRLHHVNLVGKHLDQEELGDHSLILAGDFNSYGRQLTALEDETFLGNAQRLDLQNQRTGLKGDFSRQIGIDHVYISQDLEVLSGACSTIWKRLKSQSCEATVLSKPKNPWGSKESPSEGVAAASDHVPVSVLVKVV